jgi:pimeloyl-ACP methyl ester carboxylesterase
MDKSWLDRNAWPFAENYLRLDVGRLHYVDEGEGEPIVFVHGTPVWSFVWRDFIRAFRSTHRCIAVDHLGFGLSDKPPGWSYRPEDHARNLSLLIHSLGLEGYTLVVHDLGGAIGLAQALERPEQVRRIVLLNTWMWPVLDDSAMMGKIRWLDGWMGRWLYRHWNFSPRFLLPMAFHDRRRLSPHLHRQYARVHRSADERNGLFGAVQGFRESAGWYEQLWKQRERIANIPALALWGLADPFLGPDKLDRWKDLFDEIEVVAFEDCGHFVQEEKTEAALAAMQAFWER